MRTEAEVRTTIIVSADSLMLAKQELRALDVSMEIMKLAHDAANAAKALKEAVQ